MVRKALKHSIRAVIHNIKQHFVDEMNAKVVERFCLRMSILRGQGHFDHNSFQEHLWQARFRQLMFVVACFPMTRANRVRVVPQCGLQIALHWAGSPNEELIKQAEASKALVFAKVAYEECKTQHSTFVQIVQLPHPSLFSFASFLMLLRLLSRRQGQSSANRFRQVCSCFVNVAWTAGNKPFAKETSMLRQHIKRVERKCAGMDNTCIKYRSSVCNFRYKELQGNVAKMQKAMSTMASQLKEAPWLPSALLALSSSSVSPWVSENRVSGYLMQEGPRHGGDVWRGAAAPRRGGPWWPWSQILRGPPPAVRSLSLSLAPVSCSASLARSWLLFHENSICAVGFSFKYLRDPSVETNGTSRNTVLVKNQ